MMKSDSLETAFHGWKGCSFVLVLVAIMTLALSSQSCRSTKQALQRDSRDSLRMLERLTASLATIPMSKVTLPLTVENLRKLPPGARYTAKNGQASAEVEMRGGTIYVTATCDSLQQLVFEYQKELTRVSSDAENYKKEVDRTVFKTLFIHGLIFLLIGFITGVIVTIKIKQKWQK